MAGLDHITGFSYRSHVSVEGRSPGDYALKAAGQPRRFPVHRKTSDQRRKDPSEDSDSTEDERVWRDVMFGTCKQGSEVDEVLDYMDRQVGQYRLKPSAARSESLKSADHAARRPIPIQLLLHCRRLHHQLRALPRPCQSRRNHILPSSLCDGRLTPKSRHGRHARYLILGAPTPRTTMHPSTRLGRLMRQCPFP
jgi:hypothetical protein